MQAPSVVLPEGKVRNISTLYELTGKMAALLALLEDPEIDEQLILDSLESIDYEIDLKAEGYGKIIRTLQGEAEVIGEEIERLSERRRHILAGAERIKRELEGSMILLGKRKVKTPLFSFSIQKNPPSVCLIKDVPKRFLIKQEPKVDKRALIEYLKEHGNTEYAELVQSESLRIR